jgi:uncharacterized protein (DUF2062 family)
MMPIRFLAGKLKRFFIYRVFSLDDTPHRIALGVGVGIFVAWTPTIGFQMILTIAISALLRANKLVGVPFVWISNPVTLVPIYAPNYWVGRKLLGGGHSAAQFVRQVREAMAVHGGWIDKIQAWWSATWNVFGPLWTGSIIVGLILGAIAYVIIYYAVVIFRAQRRRRHPAEAK